MEDKTIDLTVRQKEVLVLMAEGMNNKQIADKLSLSVHTVKSHVDNVLEKFDCDSRTGAVAKAIRGGYI